MRDILENPIIYQKGAKEHIKRQKEGKLTEEDIDNWIWLMEDFVAFLGKQQKEKEFSDKNIKPKR